MIYIFWPIKTLNWLFCHYSGQSIASVKIENHVALLSDPTVYYSLIISTAMSNTKTWFRHVYAYDSYTNDVLSLINKVKMRQINNFTRE